MIVPSRSQPGRAHVVTREDGVWSCTCPSGNYRGWCQHIEVVIHDRYRPVRLIVLAEITELDAWLACCDGTK